MKLITVCYKCGSRNIVDCKRKIKNGRYDPNNPNTSEFREVDATFCNDCQKYRMTMSKEVQDDVIAQIYNKDSKALIEDVTLETIEKFHYDKNPYKFNDIQLADYMTMSCNTILVDDYLYQKYHTDEIGRYKLSVEVYKMM